MSVGETVTKDFIFKEGKFLGIVNKLIASHTVLDEYYHIGLFLTVFDVFLDYILKAYLLGELFRTNVRGFFGIEDERIVCLGYS